MLLDQLKEMCSIFTDKNKGYEEYKKLELRRR